MRLLKNHPKLSISLVLSVYYFDQGKELQKINPSSYLHDTFGKFYYKHYVKPLLDIDEIMYIFLVNPSHPVLFRKLY